MNNLVTAYGSRAAAADSSYPHGGFKNATTPLTGTPLDRKWQNDWLAFFSKMMVEAGLTPNNVTDTVLSSQLYSAFLAVVASEASVLIAAANKYSTNWKFSGIPENTEYSGKNNAGASNGSGRDIFLGAGAGGTYKAIRSENFGVSWTASTTTFKQAGGLAYGNGVFVIVANDPSTNELYAFVIDGTDPNTWNAHFVDNYITDQFKGLVFTGTYFVAVTDNGRMYRSADGETWASVTLGLDTCTSLATNGDEYVISCGTISSNPYISFSSQSGLNQFDAALPVGIGVPYSVTYGDGKIVVTGSTGAYYSEAYPWDTWTTISTPTTLVWLEYGEDLGFYAGHDSVTDTNKMMSSTDGINWFYTAIPTITLDGSRLVHGGFKNSYGTTNLIGFDTLLINGVK